MRKGIERPGAAARVAAALLALLMLSYASVRSDVMQAAMAATAVQGAPPGSAAAVMGEMAGTPMGERPMTSRAAARGHASPTHHAGKANCAYCAIAAHVPTLAFTARLRPPIAFRFAHGRAAAAQGPRGPPETTPRARGPPDLSLQG